MKSFIPWVLVIVAGAAAAAGGFGYWLGHRGAAPAGNGEEQASTEPAKAEDKAVATVSVMPARRDVITEEIIAYGTIVTPASEIQVVSVPFEARVARIFVTPGQVVSAGQPLVEVEASAATLLAMEEAGNAVEAAKRDLELVQQRYNEKMATNAELFAAQNALKTAQARLESLQQAGAAKPRPLKSDVPGVVSKVDVQVGQVVPIGGPLVEIAAQNRIEARLGAGPEDVGYFKVGQPAQLTQVDDPSAEAVTGTIRLIGQRVDPVTRLVDVMVSLPPGAKLMLEGFVAGKLAKASAEGIVVPRDAVLPGEEGGYVLFTVKDGRAVRHAVRIGVDTDRQVQVLGEDVKVGDLVVVVGNYELEDGMAVEAHQATATEPTSGPTLRTASDPETRMTKPE